MEFTPIQPLWESLTQPVQSVQPAGRTPASSLFARVFQSAIDNVRETSRIKSHMEYQLATGQIDNPAEVSLAITKAEIASDLLMEMRNKAVDVYNELMRLSV